MFHLIVIIYLGEFDDLAGAETELLVVIQHCVHVLDPDGVHWPVEHIPPLVIILSCSPDSDQRRQDPISPKSGYFTFLASVHSRMNN